MVRPPPRRSTPTTRFSAVATVVQQLLLLLQPAVAPFCGGGTSHDSATDTCVADCAACAAGGGSADGHDDVYIACISDHQSGGYANHTKHHFNLAVQLLNNKTDGFWDDVFADGAEIKSVLAHSGCSANLAGPAYWAVRGWGRPLHGVVGCRCSGASMAVQRVAQLEHVPQISYSSTSPKLSNTGEYPYFYRTVAPDGPAGGVGALVQLFRAFDWESVTVAAPRPRP
jgi:hypothetical protein